MNLSIYSPSAQQLKQLELLIKILDLSHKNKIKVVVTGGYGLDALYGKLTRDHHDIDLFINQSDSQEFTKIISDLHFYPTGNIIGDSRKSEFKSNYFPKDFTIEFGYIENGLKLIPEASRDNFIPKFPVGSLNNFPILTPTIYGFREIISINNELAKNNNSPEYSHKEWMNEILLAIEKKLGH